MSWRVFFVSVGSAIALPWIERPDSENTKVCTDEVHIRARAKVKNRAESLEIPLRIDELNVPKGIRVRIDAGTRSCDTMVMQKNGEWPSYFRYTVHADDPDVTKLEFWMQYDAGAERCEYVVCIDNRADLVPGALKMVAQVTGKPLPEFDLVNPNRTDERFDVGGTDLGIIWQMDRKTVGIAFGDSYGSDCRFVIREPVGSNWRCNLLAFSHDRKLEDGLTFSGMVTDEKGAARELIFAPKDKSGEGDWTAIPTAAVRIGEVDYMHYMMVRYWGGPKDWNTNYSAVRRSTDGGWTWEPTPIRFDSTSHFAQAAYAKQNGYVYMLGTQSGRSDAVRLLRFREQDIEQQDRYEFWHADRGWIVGDEEVATPLFDDTVGEISLIYHKKYRRWIVLYFCKRDYAIVMRDAAIITGPWSEAKVVAHGREFPQLYGSFIHPWVDDRDHLYFLMSMWRPYNVFLMKLDIAPRE